DQRPARRGRDRRRARAAVSADRRHHDIVGERTRGPADAERRRAAGRSAAVGGGATEPDDERSRTGLCHVALARRRPAHGAPVAGWMLAAGARAVAGIGGAGVAVVRARGARVAGRVLAGVAGAVALVQRAGIGVGGAGGRGRLLGVSWTGGARPGAGLRDVALARTRTADRGRVARRVLAVGAGAVALVEGAGVAVVGTGRPARLPRTVGGTRRARAGAGLGEIAFPGGGAAGRSSVPPRVLAAGAW